MSTTTKIEWTRGADGSPGKTWNPIIGCDRVSPGCDRCYAMGVARIREFNPNPKIQAAFAGTTLNEGNGVDWTGKVNLLDGRLTEPLSWKKPAKVFVNSMSDLFHKDVPHDFIVRTFAIMALTPQHTYQILTKRHARMRSVLQDICKCGNGHVPGVEFRSAMAWAVSKANPDRIPGLPDDAEHRVYFETPWPLPNVHVGVSVENQKWADIRIPALVETPAAVRFVSAEPLLGPVDLTKWMPPVSPVAAADAPESWADWEWPDWVPTTVREHIEGSWGPDQYRKPADWIRDMHQQGAPAFGATVRMDDGFGQNPRRIVGRYVHAWNNIGRLILADDPDRSFAYTSFGSKTRRRQQPINWTIVGGESGPGARPAALDWFRDLRDQCEAADVPFLFKQHGQYRGFLTADEPHRPADLFVNKETGEALPEKDVPDSGSWSGVWSLGKKRAGRILDGREHNGYPAVSA